MTLLLDLLGFLVRVLGLMVIVAFILLAAIAVVDWARELGYPICPHCGLRHHDHHEKSHP